MGRNRSEWIVALFVISLGRCTAPEVSNFCDPNSESFLEISFLRAMMNDPAPLCGVGSPGISLGALSGTVSETGESITAGSSFVTTVRLGGAPSGSVILNLTSTDTAAGTVSPAQITFTAMNWMHSQTITVKAVNDVLINGTRSFKIRVNPASSEDQRYKDLPVQEITMQVTDNDKRLFLTGTTSTGSLGGVTGADGLCQSDPQCAVGKTCKALMVDAGSDARIATLTADAGDGQVDWVLTRFSHYYRIDGTTMVTYTEGTGLFHFPFANPMTGGAFSLWTGFGSGAGAGWTANAVDHCLGWTSNSSLDSGGISDSTGVTAATFFLNTFTCDNTLWRICVEQ